MSLAYDLSAEEMARAHEIRAEREAEARAAVARRDGRKMSRKYGRDSVDHSDVDILCRAAESLASGPGGKFLDHEALREQLGWKLERFVAAHTLARQIDRWPYSQVRPAKLTPPPATPRPSQWPVVTQASRVITQAPEVITQAPEIIPPTPSTITETAPVSTATASTPAYQREQHNKLSPLLLDTLKTADRIQVDGRVDYKELASELKISEKAAWCRIQKIRDVQGWPYQSVRKPGQHGEPRSVSIHRARAAEARRAQAASTEPPGRPMVEPPIANVTTTLESLRTALAAQAAVLDTFERIPLEHRPGVLRWLVDHQAVLAGVAP